MKEGAWELVAHRGLVELYPENSLEAALAAWHRGVAVEIDVHTLSCGTFICMHDETLERTTSAIGALAEAPLSDITYQDLRDVSLIDSRLPTSKFTIPRLDSLFEQMATNSHFFAYLDIKEAPLEKLIALIKFYQIEHQIAVTTPVFDVCKEIHERLPSITTQFWISHEEEDQMVRLNAEALKLPYIDTILFILQEGTSEPFQCSTSFLKEAWNQSREKQLPSALFYTEFTSETLFPLLDIGYRRLSTDAISSCRKIIDQWNH